MIAYVRRQPTRYVWPLFLAASLAFIFSRHGQFRGYWLWTADWTAGTVILTGPIAAAIAAWHARFQVKHMQDATRMGRGLRAVWPVFLGELTLLLSAQALAVLVAVLDTASLGTHVAGSAAHFLPQFFVLAGFIALGATVGFLLPTPYTAPVIGVLAFVVQLPAVSVLPRALVKFGGATANLVGLHARTSFDLAHIAAGVGVLLVGATVAALAITRRRPDAAALTAGLAGVALLVPSVLFFASTDQERFTVPTTVAVRCSHASAAPAVCLPADAEQLRATLTALASDTIGVERAAGATRLPTRLVVVPAGATPGAYTPGGTDRPMVLQADGLDSRVDQLEATLPYLIIDRRCLDLHASEDLATTIGDLQVAADLVLLSLTPDAGVAAVPEVRIVQSWPAAKRTTWLRQVLDAANSCTLSAMPAPVS
ncbi:MAG: hypothetical protein ACTHMS_20630 [Jatrophihabitans sp.]|uniref:hypothetical protein n=1 Tax=Jatrophihabitans sp. TaxID=1932789 RepID=UPI003F80ADEB